MDMFTYEQDLINLLLTGAVVGAVVVNTSFTVSVLGCLLLQNLFSTISQISISGWRW